MLMKELYSSLIIDIVKSKSYSIENRNQIQQLLSNTIDVLNQLFCDQMIRPVDFSAGDEIQGLFASPGSAYMYYRLVSLILHPVKIRAGIGTGSWDIQLADKGTTGQDGTVYHYARHAIKNTDAGEGYPVLMFTNTYSDRIINAVIGSASAIAATQSTYQNHLMLLLEFMFPVMADLEQYLPHSLPSFVADLLRRKSEFNHIFERIDKELPLDRANYLLNYTSHFNDAHKEDTFFITSGRQRGASIILADILGISRQSIDKTIKASNIFTARNMAIAAIQELHHKRQEE